MFCLFHAFYPFWEELYQNPVQFFYVISCGIPLNPLQQYVKREKCKVNEAIFPSGCEISTINLDNKNMKIDIFTAATSVRLKNISRYPTGNYEIKI